MCGCFNQPFFTETRINAEKSNSVSYTAGQSNWVSCLRRLFLTLYPSVSVDMELRHNQYSEENSSEWFHMDRRWMDKQKLFWANTNINCAPWWPWETHFLGKRPEAAWGSLCHGGSQTALQLSACQRQARTRLWRCSHCLLFPAVKFQ